MTMRLSAGIMVPLTESQPSWIGLGKDGYRTHLLNLQDISRNDLRRPNFPQSTAPEDNSLESKGFLEFVDNRTGLEFLNKTDAGIQQEQSADDTEVNPILETSSQNGGSLL